MTGLDTPWFRRITTPSAPSVRLVCFPHAGGTARAFHGWGPRVPADVELLAVRYPGRHDRLVDPCIDRMEPLVEAIVAALGGVRGVPLAFFGHSMGASVAHEVARVAPPALLMVSGRRPPHLLRPRPAHEQGDAAIIADVKRLGEASAGVLDDPELRDLVMPAIRADYSLVGHYRPGVLPPIPVPIVAYTGVDDVDAPPDDMRVWAGSTTAGFAWRDFPGGHFYLADHEADLVADVVERVRTHVLTSA